MNRHDILEAAFTTLLARDGAPNGSFLLTPHEVHDWWEKLGTGIYYLGWTMGTDERPIPCLLSRI